MKLQSTCRWLSRTLPAASLLAYAALHSTAHTQAPSDKYTVPIFLSAPLVQIAPIQTSNGSLTDLTTTPTLYVVMLKRRQRPRCECQTGRAGGSVGRPAVLASRVSVSPKSSGFGNNLGELRSLLLIDYPDTGTARATSLLFPEGLL